MDTAVVEIFSSIQGEGKYVGCRQVFLRLAGCNLACSYCDTPASRQTPAACWIEKSAGQRDFFALDNPLTAEAVAGYINHLLESPHHSVSITGGEPLCQVNAVIALATLVRGKVYLETNGTLPLALEAVLPHIAIISMDIKLPSIAGRAYWDEHLRFLRLAAARDLFVKIVITAATEADEFIQAMRLVAAVDRRIPVVLQPVTPVAGVAGVSPAKMLVLQAAALSILDDVRVIPQTHKLMGQL
jgi:7-carboxy-7-deazaguanine synthase